jgi:hypothetical protein
MGFLLLVSQILWMPITQVRVSMVVSLIPFFCEPCFLVGTLKVNYVVVGFQVFMCRRTPSLLGKCLVLAIIAKVVSQIPRCIWQFV